MSFEDKLIRLYELRETFSGKRIIIFGAGKEGKVLNVCLDMLSLSVDYYVDNFCGDKGELLLGKEVHKPEKIKQENGEQVIVLIASYRTIDISKQLKEMGFIYNKNFFTMKEDRSPEQDKNNKLFSGVKVGKYTYGYEEKCIMGVVESIGSFCSINNTFVAVANHPLDYITTHPILYTSVNNKYGDIGIPGVFNDDVVEAARSKVRDGYGKITIKNDVWIGADAIVFRGVTINNGAVVGAGAVVTKDVPSYAIVAGVPAKIIKYRFSEEQILILNKIKWWDWSDEKIIENAKFFYDIELFIKKHGKFI